MEYEFVPQFIIMRTRDVYIRQHVCDSFLKTMFTLYINVTFLSEKSFEPLALVLLIVVMMQSEV